MRNIGRDIPRVGPSSGGPVAKIVGLGWYITVAGEDALDAVIKPYVDAIASANTDKFPARDYVATAVAVQSSHRQAEMPVSMNLRAISVSTDIGHSIRVIDLNGKMVYTNCGKAAGKYSLPHLDPGVYVVKATVGKNNYTNTIALF
jgi:hypothetical protein